MFKKNAWIAGLLTALVMMFVGCVDPIAEEDGVIIELLNLQEIIKDAPDGLISDWGQSVFAGTPFMKCGGLNISIVTEGGVKKLKLDGMTQTWGEGLDIRHVATADGNSGVGYKAGDEIYIKGKVTPANDGLLVNASGGGYSKVENLGDEFDSTVVLTQDNVTAIKSGNPQTIRLHYDSNASRIGTIIFEQIIITGKRAAGEGPEPPPDYSIPGSGSYKFKELTPALEDNELYIDLNPAEISILSPLGHFPVSKIDATKLEVKFDWNAQGIFIPFTSEAKSIITSAANAGFDIEVEIDGSGAGPIRWCVGANRTGSWNVTNMNGNVSPAVNFDTIKTLTVSSISNIDDLDGIVLQSRPLGAQDPNTAIPSPFTLTISKIKVTITEKDPTEVTQVRFTIGDPKAGLPVLTSVSGTGWTGAVSWVPTPIDGKFATSTVYYANVVITPTPGYYFDKTTPIEVIIGSFTGATPGILINGVANNNVIYNPATRTITTDYFPRTGVKPAPLPEGKIFDLADWLGDNVGETSLSEPLQNAGGPTYTIDSTGITVSNRKGGNYEGIDIILLNIDERVDPAIYKLKVEVKGKITNVRWATGNDYDTIDTSKTTARMVVQGGSNPYNWIANTSDYDATSALKVDDEFTLTADEIPANFVIAGNGPVRIQTGNSSDRSEFKITSIVITNQGPR